MPRGGPTIGRDDELAAIDAFLTSASQGPCGLVLSGEPGIGKTTLWEAAVARAADRGHRVLTHRGMQAEAEFGFAALTDLVAPVLDEVADALAMPRRHALNVALLLEGAGKTPPDERAIGLAFLDVLGQLTRRGPVVVALDDLQWLDASSARVIPIALRRLRAECLGVIVAVREAPGSRAAFQLEQALPGHAVEQTSLGPLGLTQLHRLLRERLGVELRRPELTRIERASAGNPFFALELTATIGSTEPGRAIAVPESLRELLGGRLERLSEETRDVLLDVAALARPTREVISAARTDHALTADALHTAARERVLVLEGSRVRFTHPLLASLCYEEALPSRRRAAHRRLARVLHDREERARHLRSPPTGPTPHWPHTSLPPPRTPRRAEPPRQRPTWPAWPPPGATDACSGRGGGVAFLRALSCCLSGRCSAGAYRSQALVPGGAGRTPEWWFSIGNRRTGTIRSAPVA